MLMETDYLLISGGTIEMAAQFHVIANQPALFDSDVQVSGTTQLYQALTLRGAPTGIQPNSATLQISQPLGFLLQTLTSGGLTIDASFPTGGGAPITFNTGSAGRLLLDEHGNALFLGTPVYQSFGTPILGRDRYVTSGDMGTHVAVLDRSVSFTEVSGINIQQIYSTTIPANALGTNRMLRVTVDALGQQPSAASNTLTWRVIYGTSVLASGTSGTAILIQGRNLFMQHRFIAANSTSQQYAFTQLMHAASAAPASGTNAGAFTSTTIQNAYVREDTTQALPFSIWVNFASFGASIIPFSVVTELV